MQNLIEKVLKDQGIAQWSIQTVHEYSAELFFIRRNLDTRRIKETEKYNVSVYRDFEVDGQKMRGMSGVGFVPGQSEAEIAEAIKSAYFAASFVENPTYELPEKHTSDPVTFNDTICGMSASDAAMKMAEAVFVEDHLETSFLNSLEVFAVKKTVHLQTSNGASVSYGEQEINGEFVVQCKKPQDVEVYKSFRYDTLATEALSEKARTALQQVADRAVAVKSLKTGNYDVILSDDAVAAVLDFYSGRTSAKMVYPGYSQWKIGDNVQKQPIVGEALNISLKATVPYSTEGIPMVDKSLLVDGNVQTFHGDSRMSSYLNIQPTGEYNAIICNNGTVPFEEMKKKPFLYPVVFSDFQMDIYSGHFGGEMRLAYYFDGEKMNIVTGGAINGSILDCSNDLVFSTERYKSLSYEGPYAMLLKNVSISGIEA